MIAAALISYLGIDFFRRYSLERNWVDIPNERSSHTEPTPRGGGLVIVLICLVAYPAICLLVPNGLLWGYYVGAFLIAAVSWFDDLYSIPIGWRLLVHFAAAILLVVTYGYWQTIDFPLIGSVSLGLSGSIVTVIWIVWVINAYNFMDGIDGIAVVQALLAAAAWVVIASQSGAPGSFFYFLVLFGTCVGFLFHNWPPARIFMGDIGSAFLGFTFGAAPLILGRESGFMANRLPIAAMLILWPFLFDTVLSRFRRLLKTRRAWLPHRDHLYQKLAIAGYKHGTVSIVYGLLAAVSAAVAVVMFSEGGDITLYLISLILFLTVIFVAVAFWLTRSPNREEHR